MWDIGGNFMIITREINTGKILEVQSEGNHETLLNNAKNSGYTEDKVDIKEISEEEWETIIINK